MSLYPARALERAMKIQEVILRAASGKILWMQAAEILGISPRSMQRWKRRYEEHGYDGLFDRRQKRPSPKRVPMATVEKVLRLYREQYFDFNVKHFTERSMPSSSATAGSRRRCRRRAWWPGSANAGGTVNSGHDGRCRGCCCMSTGVGMAG
jgi:hypothetical protein